MIVSASYRSDIPAFYAEWFLARLRAGFAVVANPYGGPPSRVMLTSEAVEGFVFWTRNPRPFLAAFEAVRKMGLPFVVQFTITGYPRALERSVPPVEQGIAAARELAESYGPKCVVWRYDPILLTSLMPPEWHVAQFSRLADALAGISDEVVLSFAQIYAKTHRNTEAAARRHGFSWNDPEAVEKKSLLARLARSAGDRGLRPSLCSQASLLSPGLEEARCIDAERLSAIAGHEIKAREKGNRPDCRCAESRDIGAYDSCPHGCVYCYAVSRPALAKKRHAEHDPAAPALAPKSPIPA